MLMKLTIKLKLLIVWMDNRLTSIVSLSTCVRESKDFLGGNVGPILIDF